MKIRQAIILLILLVFSVQDGISQVSFDVFIRNYGDTSVLLASYYGTKYRLIDTAYLEDGKFTFYNKEYPAGVYILADQHRTKLFEFIINNESGFSLQTDTEASYDVTVSGSEENAVFYTHQKFRNEAYREIQRQTDSLSGANTAAVDSIREGLKQKELDLITNHQELFIARLIKAQQTVITPDSLQNDSIKSFLYLKNHYWDNMDLNDSRFTRTPILEKKLDDYFKRFVFPAPDSVIREIDSLIVFARPDDEMVSFLLWYFMVKYQNPEYMGFDAVFVHLVDVYFLREEIPNSTPSIIEKLRERSEKMKPLLIGKTAPDLNLLDTSNQFLSFRDIEAAYTFLLFWDYNCHVCENTMMELEQLLDTSAYDIRVYAVNVNNDLKKWKMAVSDKKTGWVHVNGTVSTTPDFHDLYDISGTPRLFLLGPEKKIMGKNFKVSQIFTIIENEKQNK